MAHYRKRIRATFGGAADKYLINEQDLLDYLRRDSGSIRGSYELVRHASKYSVYRLVNTLSTDYLFCEYRLPVRVYHTPSMQIMLELSMYGPEQIRTALDQAEPGGLGLHLSTRLQVAHAGNDKMTLRQKRSFIVDHTPILTFDYSLYRSVHEDALRHAGTKNEPSK